MQRTARVDSRWWLIVAVLAAVYLIINLALPLFHAPSFFKTYILEALLWALIALIVIRMGRYRPAARMTLRPLIIQMALVAGVFQVVLYGIGGLFTGFGRSPTSFAPISIIGNLLFVGGALVGTEVSRAWLMNHLGRRVFLSLAFVTILFVILSTPLGQLTGLRANLSTVNYVDSTLLPALASGLLASFLALLAGPLASMAYMGMLQAFWWFCPVLPDLSWAFKGLIGTAVPIIALVSIRGYYVSKTERRRAVARSEGSIGGWVAISVISVALIWFAVGIFPIRPSLVASGSMTPALQVGDITIVVKTPTDDIKVGDIIDYKLTKSVDVVHRVISVEQADSGTQFITKGDANDAPDEKPVLADNVIGKVVFTVRKVGWLAVFVKGFFAR